jgi:hypothetical protein
MSRFHFEPAFATASIARRRVAANSAAERRAERKSDSRFLAKKKRAFALNKAVAHNNASRAFRKPR